MKINKDDAPVSPTLAPGRKPSPRVAFVNYDQCTGCEACIAVAPWDNCLIRISDEPATSHVKTNNSACTGCTLCMKICPWDAITMVPRPAQ
jgi:Pyruvate/2-oxoacid:ferredoxin oxidoreductase delta subunit